MCEIAGSIFLFKLEGRTPDCVILKRNWIWDILKLDKREISLTLHGNNNNLQTSVVIPFRDKFRIRCLINKEWNKSVTTERRVEEEVTTEIA